MRKFTLCLCVLAVVSVLASSGQASVFVTSTGGYPAGTSGTDGLRDGFATSGDYAGTLGFTFTVGPDNLLVTGLGYYDGPNSTTANVAGYTGDGLNNAHEVGIWDTTASQNLFAGTTVPAGTSATLIDEFRYVSLATPITLLANHTYTVGGQVTVTDNTGGTAGDVFRNANLTVAGVDTFGPGIASVTGTPSFTGPPTNSDYNDGVFQAPNADGVGYFGGSFEYLAIVPEPSSIVALGGLAATGLCFAARRRR